MSTSSDSKTIAVLNGPNLNLLGTRQPEIYGRQTLADIEAMCVKHSKSKGFDLRFQQTNIEGELVSMVQEARTCAAVLINAAGYTHTSVALLDALLTVDAPVIEVHLSSPHKREAIRHRSVIAPACTGVIAGFGALSYRLALDAAIALVDGSLGITEG
ncbi:type II 3-dehydroquinate dehydratase [Parvularcula lutaonensis]|uniref:3-dehydroquinate dehydratase n=1 Tax=Parvularcula lutaonensis TaxID=491923 RepID=A0ABV7M7J7_9PROT|nr:type II 3-dehydroquinate dehydratase [Parvularcula lutaonensis]GGY41537.1 3-dehydroquinate dehydratase [Parvularcula lutaonensis]